ncbi:hypothetical protein QTP86_022976, partial [Hemibagrus guttatus]
KDKSNGQKNLRSLALQLVPTCDRATWPILKDKTYLKLTKELKHKHGLLSSTIHRCLIIATLSLMCQWESYSRTLIFSPPSAPNSLHLNS